MLKIYADIADIDTINVTLKRFNIKTRLVLPHKNKYAFAKRMKLFLVMLHQGFDILCNKSF